MAPVSKSVGKNETWVVGPVKNGSRHECDDRQGGDMRGSNQNRPSLDRLLARMKAFRPDGAYYAITLTVNDEGKLLTQTQTHFKGFADGQYHSNRELRVAVKVDPNKMISLWQAAGLDHIVVDDNASLFVFLHIGGNALVEENLARKWKPEWLASHEVTKVGLCGWLRTETLPSHVFRHAPTPKHRMRILKRDSFRCTLCGRSPEKHVDVELHVHHIRPFGTPHGGVTHDDNLITLCHTCHKGLEPHADPNLFDLVGSGIQAVVHEVTDEYFNGVRRYRERVRAMLKEPEKGNAT
jgi:hypothetical protein